MEKETTAPLLLLLHGVWVYTIVCLFDNIYHLITLSLMYTYSFDFAYFHKKNSTKNVAVFDWGISMHLQGHITVILSGQPWSQFHAGRYSTCVCQCSRVIPQSRSWIHSMDTYSGQTGEKFVCKLYKFCTPAHVMYMNMSMLFMFENLRYE